MKAVIFSEPGGPEKLQYTDVPTPAPKSGEALIRVRATALNHLDIWIRSGVAAYGTKLPHIGGCDISGTIEALNPGDTTLPGGFKKASRVMIFPGRSCWSCPACLSGRDNLCASYSIIGAGSDGGLAEYCVAPIRNLIPLPETISFEEAAAFSLVTLTSWHMLITRAQLKPKETVLVLGASSGIGTAAVQIGRLTGCRVLATVGSDDKKSKVKALGADEVINHTTEDFQKRVKELTAGRGVDVVFEHIGPTTWEQSIKSLVKGGRLVTCGATTGPEVKTDLRYVFSRELSIFGAVMGTRAEMMTLVDHLAAGRLKAVIDSKFPLAEARQAQEKMAGRNFFGKIVVLP